MDDMDKACELFKEFIDSYDVDKGFSSEDIEKFENTSEKIILDKTTDA